MPAPLAKGLIIAASVIVAAGIALYESPQVRQWVDQSRRKIAVALHSLGDELQPRHPSESEDDFEERKRRREELVRKNRNDLIRRARAEGIAVDLDELARIGREDIELAERRQRHRTSASQRSFDDLVGSDGMLRKDPPKAQTATGIESSTNNLRQRSVAGFTAGAAAGATVANPFSDDQVLFDHDNEEEEEEEAASPKPFIYTEPATRESSATVGADNTSSPTADQLIDLTPQSVPLQPEDYQMAPIPQFNNEDNATQSFYSFTSAASNPQFLAGDDEEPEIMSAGTLTPRSDRSAFTGASVVGSQADDIAILSMQNDTDHDARSEVFSEGGFTDAGFSEAGFSEVGENRGILTPSSWTDVGSDDESEWGGPAQGGHVTQIHQ